MPAAPGTIPALPLYQPGALPLAGTEALELVSNYANATAGGTRAITIQDLIGKAPSVMTTANPTASDQVAFYQTASGLPKACSVGNLSVPFGNVPTGGTAGQVLAKNSATNFDASWYSTISLLATAFQTTNLPQNGILFGNGTNLLGITAFGPAGTFLSGNGSTLAPTFQQVNLTTGATGVLTQTFGGLGTASLASHAVVLGSTGAAVAAAVPGAANLPLVSNGAAADPTFQTLNLAAGVVGVLPVANGGIGTSSLASHGIVLGSTGAYAVVPSTTAGLVLAAAGAGVDPIFTSAVTLLGLGPAATATLGNIPGDVASTQALAGNIGEYTTANLGAGSALSLSTVSVATTIASIALAAGDWNVFGEVTFFATNTTTVGKILAAAVNNASNALPNFTSGAIHQLGLGSAGLTAIQTTCLPIGPVQFISSAVQTAYLIAAVNFTNATMGGFGVISARRAR